MLMQLLRENASTRPDDLAIVYRDERVTYAELVERVERLAAGLGGRGHRPRRRRRPAAAATTRGSSPASTRSRRSARSSSPFNPAFKQAELEFYFRTAGVRAVISDERTRRRVRADRRRAGSARSR